MEGLAMANGRKSRIPSSLLWGGIGVIILLLGVGSALFYLNRGQEESAERFGTIKGMMSRFSGDKEEGMMPPGAPPAGPIMPDIRTYTVRKDENLWAIARRGELVDSPWGWPAIVRQNREKISYSTYSTVERDPGVWTVFVNTGRELTVTSAPPGEPKEVPKKLALQLLSAPERNLSRAMDIVKMLLRDGYYAYLYLIDVNGVNYYRVRVGFYETPEQAKAAGQEIHARYAEKKVFPENYIVFLPSFREMRGERLDFGVQRSHPWVIEFPQRENREQAMADLKAVAPANEFAYLAEQRDETSGSVVFRTRVGFFRTEEQAKALVEQQGQAGNGLWGQAEVTRRERFDEALPGQQVKVGKPSS
jgi:hypothetical protein